MIRSTLFRSKLFPFVYIEFVPGRVPTKAFVVDDFGDAVEVSYTPSSYRDGGGFGGLAPRRAATLAPLAA